MYRVNEFDLYFIVTYNQKIKIVYYFIRNNNIYFCCSCGFTKFSLATCRHIYAVIHVHPMDTSHLNNGIFTLYNWYKLLSNSYIFIEKPVVISTAEIYNNPVTKSKRGKPKTARY